MKKIIAMGMSLILTAGLFTGCMKSGEKLYTEDEFLDALEDKYDADFKIVDVDNINKKEAVYTVVIKGGPDIEFEVKNYLMASSEVGPMSNRIECNALTYYFISEYAYEGYVLYESGDLESDPDYYVLPKLYDSDSFDGKYTAKITTEDREVSITVLSGSDEVFKIEAGKESDFRGLCWDKNSYDLWLQYQDGKLVCYHMADETWKAADGVEKPDYIVYNLHPNWK